MLESNQKWAKSIDNNVVIIHNRCHVMMYGEGSFCSTKAPVVYNNYIIINRFCPFLV
jgi:ABC-type tungstate transport system permease subunit